MSLSWVEWLRRMMVLMHSQRSMLMKSVNTGHNSSSMCTEIMFNKHKNQFIHAHIRTQCDWMRKRAYNQIKRKRMRTKTMPMSQNNKGRQQTHTEKKWSNKELAFVINVSYEWKMHLLSVLPFDLNTKYMCFSRSTDNLIIFFFNYVRSNVVYYLFFSLAISLLKKDDDDDYHERTDSVS